MGWMYPPLELIHKRCTLSCSQSTTQVDVPSTCTTKDVPSNVLRQRSQAAKPLILCEWGYKRILREREESKEFSDCVILNSLTREKGDRKEFRRLVLRSFGKGRRETQKEFRRHDSCKSLSEELSDYYRGRHRSHPRPHSHRREKERKPQEANINLPYFHGKDNVEAYLDWEMKVEQLFAWHHTSEERKVPLATLSFQGYAFYWWTSLVRERRIHGDPPVEYWNDLKSALRKRHISSTYERELMDQFQRLRQGSMSVEVYRQQMELLLLRDGLREEERTSIARFLSGLNMKVRDKVELLPYRDLDDLAQLCIRVEQQLKRKPTPKSYGSHSYPKKDQGQGIIGAAPSKPKDDKGKTIEKQPPKARMQEKTTSTKFFRCLRRGHIVSQCATKKIMIMRGHDIYSSQDEATTSPSSSESEEAKGEESIEPCYHSPSKVMQSYPPRALHRRLQEDWARDAREGPRVPMSLRVAKNQVEIKLKWDEENDRKRKEEQTLIVKEECKQVSVFSKRTLVSTTISLELEVIPQVKELLDEGLGRITRHQIPMIGGMMNVLSGPTLFCNITHASNIFMIHIHSDSLGRLVVIFGFNTNLGAHMGHLSEQGVTTNPKRIKLIPECPTPTSIREIWGFHDLTNFYKRFVSYFSIVVAPLFELVMNHVLSLENAQERGFQTSPYSNIPITTNIYVFIIFTSVERRSPEFEEPLDLRHSLGGEAPPSMAYSLVDGASSHLFYFIFCCISIDNQISSAQVPPMVDLVDLVSKDEGEDLEEDRSIKEDLSIDEKDPIAKLELKEVESFDDSY
ncbi:putative mitochondrial protein [Glycine soja]